MELPRSPHLSFGLLGSHPDLTTSPVDIQGIVRNIFHHPRSMGIQSTKHMTFKLFLKTLNVHKV